MFYGDDLAFVHHAAFTDNSRRAAPAIVRALRRAGIATGLVVELGCGSGVLARELTARGYDVLGIDVSAGMLRIARRLAPAARFRRAALARTTLPRCDAVVALGEALTYLSSPRHRPRSLAPTLRRIARALRPGGVFIFDVIVAGPPMRYRDWRSGDDWAVLVEVSERAGVILRQIATFRSIKGRYRRSEETHAAAVYAREDVMRWLAAAGFRGASRGRLGVVKWPPRRLVFVAHKLR